jgi:plastocyanin
MSNRTAIRRRWRGGALTVGTTVLVAACGSSGGHPSTTSPSASASASQTTPAAHSQTHSQTTPAAPAAARSGHVTVSISNYAFAPATIVVTAGTKVTFTNHDQTAHTATSTTSGFDSGTVAPGQSRTVALGRPGTYAYVCQFHPFMHGVVIVRPG